MLILCLCSKCQTEHELSDKLIGKEIVCQGCKQLFVVAAKERKPEDGNFSVQSVFAAPDTDAAMADSSPDARRIRLTDEGKHVLSVPPPPRELWSGGKSDEDEKNAQHFRDFRHDSRALERFVASRRKGSDHSGLLILGIVLTILVVFSLLAWLIFLIVSPFMS
jgi:hypothetical protein